MRAKRLVRTSFESDRGAAQGRRQPPGSGWRVCGHLLVILAVALALLASWRPVPRRGADAVMPPAETLPATTQSGATPGRAAAAGQSVAPESPELNTVSFHTSTVDTAVLTAAAVLCLMFMHWIDGVFRVQLRPGITFRLLVPG